MEKIARREQILSFKSGPHFNRAPLSREANIKSQTCSPFAKMAREHGGEYP